MENENKKIGFFTRIKIAVAKLEDYGIFLEEKTSIAVKYFFLIVLIFAMVVSILQTYDVMKMIKKAYQYIQNEMADFSYENGNLTFSERIYAHDEEYDIYMIADTTQEVTEEKLEQYKEQIKTTGLIFLKDKVIYKSGYTENQYVYSLLTAQYGISSLDKAKLIEEVESIGMVGIAISIFLMVGISMYLVELVATLMDWIILSIFAFITARVCRISMNLKHCFHISIYALTLSIFLSMVYNVAYATVGFYTEYFRLVYLLISYVYVVAVILMLKSDLLKQQVEVAKIVEVQKEVHENLNFPEDKEKEDDKKEEDKNSDADENTTSDEPDGSEI